MKDGTRKTQTIIACVILYYLNIFAIHEHDKLNKVFTNNKHARDICFRRHVHDVGR